MWRSSILMENYFFQNFVIQSYSTECLKMSTQTLNLWLLGVYLTKYSLTVNRPILRLSIIRSLIQKNCKRRLEFSFSLIWNLILYLWYLYYFNTLPKVVHFSIAMWSKIILQKLFKYCLRRIWISRMALRVPDLIP